ncbi:MAG TPA: potassium channel family protein, partial [Polyangiaceae bacterium]
MSAQPLAFAAGAVLLLVVLWEAFETIVSPRRVSRRFRLTRLFYRVTWLPCRATATLVPQGRRREGFLSVFGPISLLVLLMIWAALIVLGYALMQWGAGSGMQTTAGRHGWTTDLYACGATLFTLTPGDLVPASRCARVLVVLEAGTGIGLFALVIGYLPVISQAFSRREVNVSLLDARAGSPPSAAELMIRHAGEEHRQVLSALFEQWEAWCADLLETHVSFPVLAYYRSQHANQSWVAALTAVLDACVLVLALSEDQSQRAARLTFAMARHAAVDLTLVFALRPLPPQVERLPPDELAQVREALRAAGWRVRDTPDAEAKLHRLRAMY